MKGIYVFKQSAIYYTAAALAQEMTWVTGNFLAINQQHFCQDAITAFLAFFFFYFLLPN